MLKSLLKGNAKAQDNPNRFGNGIGIEVSIIQSAEDHWNML